MKKIKKIKTELKKGRNRRKIKRKEN